MNPGNNIYPDTCPDWICSECGKRFGRKKIFGIACFHYGICGICKQEKEVTEPRDFGHLVPGWDKK